MIKKLCAVILTLLVCMQITVFSEESPCIFFAPQSMNDENEIIIPIYTKNLPQDNDGLCGIEFQFTYDTNHFVLKTDENGRTVLGTNSSMLVHNTDTIDISVQEDIVSVSYISFDGENDAVLRDGPMFYFSLIPKNPEALWNSDDYYPLRFIPGSVNLIIFDGNTMSLSGITAEGADTYVGGYNTFPTFEFPEFEDKIEFKVGISAIYVNGESKTIDASPYMKDELMIPMRALADAVGMEIMWDDSSRTVSIFYPYISSYFNMNSGDVYINAKLRADLPKPEIINGRTFVPLSTVQALFGDVLNIANNGDSVLIDFNNK